MGLQLAIVRLVSASDSLDYLITACAEPHIGV